MATFRVGAKRDLPIATDNAWDGAAAKERIFTWAGFDGDNPDPIKAADCFLIYDSDAPKLRGSFKLPFADIVDGKPTAMPGGLRAAASRLPQTDCPQDCQDRARKVLDGYFARMADMNGGKRGGGAIEHKTIPFHATEIKAAEGDAGGWEVAGYASTFGGSPDAYGDIVAKGAFADSLAKRAVKLLWQHDMSEPIGKQLSLAEDDTGLFGRWSIVPTDTGTKAHQLLAADLVDSLSIGYLTKDAEYKEDGTRVLKAVDLYEVSLVTVPANDRAVVTSFKADIPFDQLITRACDDLTAAVDTVTTVVAEAEALQQRRQAINRALNERHQQSVRALAESAKAAAARLETLLVVDEPPEAKANVAELSLRLELARRRLAAHHNQEQSA